MLFVGADKQRKVVLKLQMGLCATELLIIGTFIAKNETW